MSGYDGPVKGLLLNLNNPQGRAQSAVTDDHGIAEFSNVPQGTLYLGADHDNGYGAELDVKSNGPANVTVPMRWPSIEPIHVRSLSGTMRAPDAIPGQLEQSILSLDLLDGISGRILSGISTAARGEFDFGKLVPGIYFIRLKPYSAFHQEIGGPVSYTHLDVYKRQAKDPGELASGAVSVGVVKIQRKSLGRTLTLSSELVPFQEIDVYAKESGFVKELNVDYGDHVQKDQVLATLEIPELQLQVKEDDAAVNNATAQIPHAQDELNRVEAQHNVLQLQFQRLDSVAKSKPGLIAQQEVDDSEGKALALSLIHISSSKRSRSCSTLIRTVVARECLAQLCSASCTTR